MLCVISGIPQGAITKVKYFDVEGDSSKETVDGNKACSWDMILIDGRSYCGQLNAQGILAPGIAVGAPQGVPVEGGVVTFQSDGSVQKSGWVLCWKVG